MKSGCSQTPTRTGAATDHGDVNIQTMIPFQTTDWSTISVTEHPGETGKSLWRTLQFGELRIRIVEYSENYVADHWCTRGHIVYCIEGEMTTELKDGRSFILKKGMTYQVSDDASEHKSVSTKGVKLLIIDGSFLGNRVPDAVQPTQKR